MDAPQAPGFAGQLLLFADALRDEGVEVGTAELLDAVNALAAVPWTARADVAAALAATLAKSPDDRRVFDAVFDSFLAHRLVEGEALRTGSGEPGGTPAEGRVDLAELRARVQAALDGSPDDGELRDLARMAIAALGRSGEGDGAPGLDLQRIRRELGLGSRRPTGDPRAPARGEDPRTALERHLRRELERATIARTGQLAPARALRELDRALPLGPQGGLAEVHRVVASLKRRLATEGQVNRGRRSSQAVDVRRTLRASLETGGVPLRLAYRPRRPRRPELHVVCDVSTSVTNASVFFLSVLHALHDSFRDLRSFVFVERIAEVTDLFAKERSFRAVSEAIAGTAGVADVSGYTDYGRVWLEFLDSGARALGSRSTLVVLGDARTNGRDPGAETFAAVAERAGRTFWLNPEPRLYWNYGDSRMDAYAPACSGVYECWSARQLEDFARALGAARRAV